jgi:hypothetical protein
MGTRHIIQVIDNTGELRVAQYGQWDGYPSGQGVRTLFYLTHHRNEIETGLQRVRWATEAELDPIYAKYPQADYIGTEDQKTFDLLYPNLIRDTGADILLVVAYSIGEVPLWNNADFIGDGSCEGVYTLNYQDQTFTSTYHDVTWTIRFDELPDHVAYLEMYKQAQTLHQAQLEKDEEANA